MSKNHLHVFYVDSSLRLLTSLILAFFRYFYVYKF